MTDRDIVTPGQIAYDRVPARHDATALVVIDPAPGPVGDQDPETRDAIRSADANDDYDTSDSASCVEVAYADGHLSSETYTFPRDRLRGAVGQSYTMNNSPSIWAKARMLCDLYMATGLTEMGVMAANIDGRVLLCAEDMLARRPRYDAAAATDSDVASTEVMDCPECGMAVDQVEAIESVGDGSAFGTIECRECGWRAREQWEHTNTYEVDHE